MRLAFSTCDSLVMRAPHTTASFPIQHTVRSLPGSLHYKLIAPVDVWIDKDESEYLVYDDDHITFGTGSSIREALEDYCQSLITELENLRKDRAQLAPPLLRDLQFLEAHIQDS